MPNKFILQIYSKQPCRSSSERLACLSVGGLISCNNNDINGFLKADCPVLKAAGKNQTLSN
jgi:hypothetical protein